MVKKYVFLATKFLLTLKLRAKKPVTHVIYEIIFNKFHIQFCFQSTKVDDNHSRGVSSSRHKVHGEAPLEKSVCGEISPIKNRSMHPKCSERQLGKLPIKKNGVKHNKYWVRKSRGLCCPANNIIIIFKWRRKITGKGITPK